MLDDSKLTALPDESKTDKPETDESESGIRRVLRNSDFLALWSGQIFSQLADKVFLVLVVALISTRFQGEAETISSKVSAVMITFTLPAVLFGSLAGVFVDRWSKKGVLVGTNLLRGCLVLLLPLLLTLSSEWRALASWPAGFWWVLVITFAISTLTQFFSPAEQTLIPLIVKRRNLLSANSLYTITMMASVIIGFAIGEPLLSWARWLAVRAAGWVGASQVDPEWGANWVVGMAYIVAGLILLLLRSPEPSPSADHPHFFADLRAGWAYLQCSAPVRAALVQLVTLFCIFAALAALAVRLAELIPSLEASQFGFLLAAAGLGLAIGALVVGHWGSQQHRFFWGVAGSGGLTITLALLAIVPYSLVSSLILIGGLGFAGALIGVPMQTLIQEETPAELRGKVFGLQNNLLNIALSVPLAVASVAEARFGLSPVLLSMALIAASTGLVGLKLANGAD